MSSNDAIRPGGLKLLYLVTQGINGFSLEKVVLSPFGIVEGVTVQQHDEPFHFHASNLLGKNGEALLLSSLSVIVMSITSGELNWVCYAHSRK